jgi:hypothetical protein
MVIAVAAFSHSRVLSFLAFIFALSGVSFDLPSYYTEMGKDVD